MNYSGVFMTFEGCEGSGKTTQAQLYKIYLEQQGYHVLLTKEPGGTPVGNIIRSILLSSETMELSPRAEVLLYEASRAQHVDNVIIPALQQGYIVISDRYSDSTTAYQSGGRKLSFTKIDSLNTFATQGLVPDITVFIDLPIAMGLDRSKKRLIDESLDEGRFEEEALDFHTRVREEYVRLEQRYPERIIRINGLGTQEKILERIITVIQHKFQQKFLHLVKKL